MDWNQHTGFAPTAAVSASVTNGIATIMLPSGQSFDEHAVVLIAGATPTDLNGEARVLTTASDRITVATTAANGAATGSITVRYAPVGGWEEVFSKTNVSVFRSSDPTGSRMFLRIDDTGTQFARIVAYETMVDVDTGTGPFPTPAQMSGGGYWHKSSAASSAAAKWKMFGDGKLFYVAIASQTPSTATSDVAILRGFGDLIALAPGGDPWAASVSVAGNSTTAQYGGYDANYTSSTSNGGIFQARSITGLGSAVMSDPRAYVGILASISGNDTQLGTAPSSVDGQLKPSRMFTREQGTNTPPRCNTPGPFYFPQIGLINVLNDGDFLLPTGELAGRRLLVISAGTNVTSAPQGRCAVDATGPWR
ncbi:hypothetical protein ACFIQG_21780 [Comamonas odontotermitis]|uniref:hypothetical protein n=1 Tax=Comamonas odontotermitis TaxID=379895 RepID=UPI00366DB772